MGRLGGRIRSQLASPRPLRSLLVWILQGVHYRTLRLFRRAFVFHPRRWPLAVLLRAGRSRWPADIDVRVVTTFNRRLFETTGRRCVESHRRLNPDYEIHAYVEAETAEDLAALVQELDALGAVAHRLEDVPSLERLEKRLAPHVPAEYGGDAPDDAFLPVPGDENGYWRRNMVRWMRKVVAMHAASAGFEGVLLWADSDAYAKAPLTRNVLARFFRGASILHLKAGRPFTETGILAFDLSQPGVHEFMDAMVRFYEDEQFLSGANWSDCIAFDTARTAPGAPPARDVAVYADGGGHVVQYSPLDRYLAHGKGTHRRSGLYLGGGETD